MIATMETAGLAARNPVRRALHTRKLRLETQVGENWQDVHRQVGDHRQRHGEQEGGYYPRRPASAQAQIVTIMPWNRTEGTEHALGVLLGKDAGDRPSLAALTIAFDGPIAQALTSAIVPIAEADWLPP